MVTKLCSGQEKRTRTRPTKVVPICRLFRRHKKVWPTEIVAEFGVGVLHEFVDLGQLFLHAFLIHLEVVTLKHTTNMVRYDVAHDNKIHVNT